MHILGLYTFYVQLTLSLPWFDWRLCSSWNNLCKHLCIPYFLPFFSLFCFDWKNTLWPIWLCNSPVFGHRISVGYPCSIFISLEIISFSQTMRETSRVGNHPVWTLKCTGDLEANFVALLRLNTTHNFTQTLYQANPHYWLVYLLNRISWENEPESYLPAISFGQFILEQHVWVGRLVTIQTNVWPRSTFLVKDGKR